MSQLLVRELLQIFSIDDLFETLLKSSSLFFYTSDHRFVYLLFCEFDIFVSICKCYRNLRPSRNQFDGLAYFGHLDNS
jgi:hypothetical protein